MTATATRLPEAVARGPDALFALLAERVARAVGYDLLTVLAPTPGGRVLTRLFSSNPEQYPLGDADRVEDTAWFRQLFGRGEPIIANDGPEIERWLPGFDVFFAEQGYGALANVPVIVSGRPVGLINMMGQAGHFSPERLAALRRQLPLAALAILAAAWTTR